MDYTDQYVKDFIDVVQQIHKDLEKDLIMRPGVASEALLESAVAAPFQTFAGEDLYSTVADKAARLCYEIAKNHCFEDGNKRTALHVMTTYLDMNNITLTYTQKELEDIVIALVENKITWQDLSEWITNRAKEKSI